MLTKRLAGGGQDLLDLHAGLRRDLIDRSTHTSIHLGDVDSQAHRQQTASAYLEHPPHHVGLPVFGLGGQQFCQDSVVD